MADVFDKKTRTRIMQAVRTAETEPEQRLAEALKEIGLTFRRNDPRIFGTPDFVFRRARLAVFVDGDFWHGRRWFQAGVAPATNAEFWIDKFERNRQRDCLVNLELRRRGWSVLRLWGSEVRSDPAANARRVRARIRRVAPTGSRVRVTQRSSRRREGSSGV
jgi:DNA mismatch endonuclease (patch repair protein)